MRLSKMAIKVMDTLSTDEWKVMREIYEEIYKDWEKKTKFRPIHFLLALYDKNLADAVCAPSVGGIYVSLHILESHEWVEWRWRDDPQEEIEKRGGHRRNEWRLTQSGRRIRAPLPSPEGDLNE